MIDLILHHLRVCNIDLKRYLEEDGSMTCTIFRALLDVLYESLSWEENVAEFALHRKRVLEYALIDFNRVDFLIKLPVSLFYIRNCLR